MADGRNQSKCLSAAALALFVALAGFVSEAGEAENQPAGAGTSLTPSIQVAVDPRIELVSLIFRLAGNSEYNQGKVERYIADADQQFGKFSEHKVVALARKLRNTRGVSYDACMSLAVLLTEVHEPALRVPLTPWPESLDKRWSADGVRDFLAAAKEFVKESDFEGFVEKHKELYQETEKRVRELIAKQAHVEWFHEFFGELPQASFTIIPGLFNGGGNYGPHARDKSGKEELYCILGVWETDWHGLPAFRSGVVGTIVHEFNHSFANPIIDRHMNELQGPGEKMFRFVANQMQSQAYGDANTMMRESLVRACVVRYMKKFEGDNAEKAAIQREQGRGFLWTGEFSELLSQYEAHRDQYPTLESFASRIVEFFKQYSVTFETKQVALNQKRPKVVTMKPANGSETVDPALTAIEVTFDRPMRDGSWSMVGGGEHCPETTGKPSYDETRTIWKTPVKLKPNWSYEFMLNSGTFTAFRSAEGVPLEPVEVKFKTGPGTER